MEIPKIDLTATSIPQKVKEFWKHYEVSLCFNENNELIHAEINKKGETAKLANDVEKIVEKKRKAKNKEENIPEEKTTKKEKGKRNYKSKVCPACLKEFVPHGARQQLCDECKEKANTNKKKNKKEPSDEDGRESEEELEGKEDSSFDESEFTLSDKDEITEITKSRKKKKTLEPKTCPVCNEIFIPEMKSQKFCCEKCRHNKTTNKCKKCGNEFTSEHKLSFCPECKELIRIQRSMNKKKKYRGGEQKHHKYDESKKLFTNEDFCPVCLQIKAKFKNTCGTYKCISKWNKASEEDKKTMIERVKKLVEKVNADPKARNKIHKSASSGESLEIF